MDDTDLVNPLCVTTFSLRKKVRHLLSHFFFARGFSKPLRAQLQSGVVYFRLREHLSTEISNSQFLKSEA